MCGRFTLKTPAKKFADLFSSLPEMEFEPRYNIAPSQEIVTIRTDKNGSLESAKLRWGLIPFWAEDPKIGNRMINARSETVAEKPAFRAAFKKRRCLIATDGFYEWKTTGSHKQPVHIHMKDFRPFFFAGLWEKNSKTDQVIQSCTIITTQSNEFLQPIHDRMPVILEEDDFEMWLDPDFEDLLSVGKLMKPWDGEPMGYYDVSTRVNKPSNDDPDCLRPESQSTLFD